jgi:hypothetical protein
VLHRHDVGGAAGRTTLVSQFFFSSVVDGCLGVVEVGEEHFAGEQE